MASLEFKPDRWFPSDYATARRNFLEAVEAAGGTVESYVHPSLGPSGDELATDVALLGSPHATNVLVLVSGTHGVEGLAGSGLQVPQVQSGLRPPPGLKMPGGAGHESAKFGRRLLRQGLLPELQSIIPVYKNWKKF